MSVNDPLGDMLTRIRNAQMRKKGKVVDPRLASARQRARCFGAGRLHPRL